MKSQILGSVEMTMNEYGVSSARRVSSWLEYTHQVVSSMKEAIEKNPQDDDSIVKALNQAKTAGNLLSTLYGTTNGDTYRINGKNTKVGYDPRVRYWYKEGMAANGPSVSEPFLAASSQVLSLSVSDKTAIAGTIVGVVSANISLTGVDDVVSTLKVPGNGYAFIVSETGNIISSPDNKLNNKPLSNLNSNINIELVLKISKNKEIADVVVDNVNYIMSAVTIPATNWFLISLGNKGTLTKPIKEMIWYQMVAVIAMLLVALFILAWLMRYLLADLVLISDALEDISNGDGDLTVKIESNSNDEVGKLAGSFNGFVSKLRSIIEKVNELSLALSKQSKLSATSVSGSVEKLHQQQSEIVSIASAIEEMSTATHEIATSIEQNAEEARQTVVVSSSGQKLVSKNLISINQLSNEVSAASQVIYELSAHGDKINTITSTISAISEQTNLLALNAAIEAARAGEHGRGFAVVADEVRILSQRTHASTEEISSMITMLQNTTSKAVSVMQRCHNPGWDHTLLTAWNLSVSA
jgi:methyl-accepting chemotaxis protein